MFYNSDRFKQANIANAAKQIKSVFDKAVGGTKSIVNKTKEVNKNVADKVREKSVNTYTDKLHDMEPGKVRDTAIKANRFVRDGSDTAVNLKAFGVPAAAVTSTGFALGGENKEAVIGRSIINPEAKKRTMAMFRERNLPDKITDVVQKSNKKVDKPNNILPVNKEEAVQAKKTASTKYPDYDPKRYMGNDVQKK